MEYNINSFVEDYMKRTLNNLHLIASSSGGFEVTQLMNSLVGLVVLPIQFFKYDKYDEDAGLSETQMQELDPIAFKNIKDLYNNLVKSNRFKTNYHISVPVTFLIRHLRNSLCHIGENRVLFAGNGEELESIIFYDENTDENKKVCFELTKAELDKLVNDIFLIYSKARTSRCYTEKKYKELIDEKRKYMGNYERSY